MDAGRDSQSQAEQKAYGQDFFHGFPLQWKADMSFFFKNLARTPGFNKSKGIKFFLWSYCNVVDQVFCLFVALALITGCTVKDVRTFSPKRGELSARIEGFRSDEGEAVVSLFSVEGGFPDDMDKAWQNQRAKIESGRAHVLFTGVPYGEYALSILHDENGDNQMQSSWLGQPLEGFGFSGQPKYHFGPPVFADAAFLLVSPTGEVVVSMRYDTERKRKQIERRNAKDSKP